MSDDYLPTGAAAHRRFDHAKRQALMESVTALLRSRSDDLLSFDDVQKKLGLHISRERGLQQVPLDRIVGSQGKYREFTRSFWPKQEKLRERWKWIYVAAHSFHGLPPVELYQVGEIYFVKDGNHRISVARELGNRSVEAYVTEFISPVPLTVDTVDTDLDELVLQLERDDFLQRTRLLELRPEADIVVSRIGDYRVLQEHIAIPGYIVGRDEGRQVSWEEAVGIWYDAVYLPVVQMIRQHELQRQYPNHADADLYLWLMEHRDPLAEGVEPEKALATAARQFVEKYGSRLRWVLETSDAPGQWRERRVQPRGDNRFFADILLSLDESPQTWQALEGVLPIATREHGRLHGLFTGEAPDDHRRGSGLLHQFAARCEASVVPWKFREEIGQAGGDLYATTGGYDLVVLRQGTEEARRQDETLGTQIQGVIRRVICPVLVISETKPKLSRALLAYDGSPHSEEALYVAAHLATAWETPLTVVTVEETPRTSSATLDNALSYLKQRGIDARGFFKGGDAAAAILKTADEQGSDLILLGNTGYSPFVELFVRSTADRVLRETNCSVMVCS
jgi:nucleotide-binding universal stress UspA family protein